MYSMIFLTIAASITVWIACGTANQILCAYIFGKRQTKAEISFLVLLGPIGTFLLLLAFAVQVFLAVCARLSKRTLSKKTNDRTRCH